ncbi:unnamed protein product [Brassica rapa]|uniref:Uncharacterized protein n=2 Tax=Brassica TaxID=3705 RepID=A0A3P5Y0L3_BRACM|nr:unnamed protein product [Brassica napus]CAG7862460.1 unnamed protein product [Brassica rapa]VDC60656.1 unnamed protein product [Brassica rapa]
MRRGGRGGRGGRRGRQMRHEGEPDDPVVLAVGDPEASARRRDISASEREES